MEADPRYELTLRLRDGLEVVVRPIEAGDKAALERGLERLSEDARYARFMTPLERFTAEQLRYLTEVDHRDHEALIAFEPGSGEAVGVARFVRSGEPAVAEAAVTVVDEWQGRGLGTALCNLLAERAREEGVERFVALLLATNRAMLDTLASLGPARVVSRDVGTVEVEVELPPRGIGQHMAGVLRVAAGGTVELATPPWGLRTIEDS